MPNWIKGDLKVRGTKENIRKFLLEGLEPVNYTGKPLKTEIVCENNWEFSIKSKSGIFYIKGTRRNFIDNEIIETCINEWEEGEENIVVLEDYVAAWFIEADMLAKISKEFNIDFKVLGFEQGMQFNQDVEIIKGKIIKDEEIKFDDYEWQCIRPHIGG